MYRFARFGAKLRVRGKPGRGYIEAEITVLTNPPYRDEAEVSQVLDVADIDRKPPARKPIVQDFS
jgi:hypothetical protein